MTTVQIVALAAVALAVVLTYFPALLKVPAVSKAKPSVLKQIEAVVAVREAYQNPEIVAACNALLQALLQVKA